MPKKLIKHVIELNENFDDLMNESKYIQPVGNQMLSVSNFLGRKEGYKFLKEFKKIREGHDYEQYCMKIDKMATRAIKGKWDFKGMILEMGPGEEPIYPNPNPNALLPVNRYSLWWLFTITNKFTPQSEIEYWSKNFKPKTVNSYE